MDAILIADNPMSMQLCHQAAEHLGQSELVIITERLLKAFADISLTIIQHATGEEIRCRLTPLSGGQEDILQRPG